VEGMGIEKSIEKPGTADISHNGNLFSGKSYFPETLIKNLDDSFVGAARTKNRWAIAIQQTIHFRLPPESYRV
jgi:hypothetical protein